MSLISVSALYHYSGALEGMSNYALRILCAAFAGHMISTVALVSFLVLLAIPIVLQIRYKRKRELAEFREVPYCTHQNHVSPAYRLHTDTHLVMLSFILMFATAKLTACVFLLWSLCAYWMEFLAHSVRNGRNTPSLS